MKRRLKKRRSAESAPSARKSPKRARTGQPRPVRAERERLVHEVQLHQLELEVQNQSLREARDLLEESRARYAELYDYAPVGHLTLDRQGIVTELNLTCAALFDKERRRLVGGPLRFLLTVESRRALDAHLGVAFTTRPSSSVELAIPLADGTVRTVELVSVPPALHGVDGQGAMVHSALIDVSQRRRDDERREELLRREHQARLLAESANRIKQDFLNIVSHELRSPLMPIMMWVRALRAGGLSDTLRARAIEAIDACVKVQVAMIDDLVDVASGRQDTLRVDRRPMDLQAVVSTAVETLAPAAAAKQIEIALGVDPAPAWISGDPTRLQQVVTNLLSNAVKFTREAGRIAIALHEQGSEIVLTVSDDGEGIDPATLGEVFEPFRSREGPAPRGQGSLGLGLTIVRDLVVKHDGHVTVESAGKGRGSCFTVTLPRLGDLRPVPREAG